MGRKKTVLFLILNGRPYGGSEKHVVDLYNNVSDEKFEKYILYSEYNSMEKLLEKRENLFPVGRDIFDFFHILKVIIGIHPEIIHVHAARAIIFGRLIKLISYFIPGFTFRLISTSHGLWIPPKKDNWLSRTAIHILKSFDSKTICVSKFSRQELIDLGYKKNKVSVIYNGIDFSQFDGVRETKREVKRISFVGRFTEQKGIDTLMAVIKRDKGDLNCSYSIYGSGQLESYIEDFIKTNELSNVKLKGYSEKISEVFSSSDLIIAPSMDEGLPYVLVEAINCGLPILTTKVGGIPEIVIQDFNGSLVAKGDSEELYESLQKLKKMDIKTLSNNSINHSYSFSLAKMVASVENIYLESKELQ